MLEGSNWATGRGTGQEQLKSDVKKSSISSDSVHKGRLLDMLLTGNGGGAVNVSPAMTTDSAVVAGLNSSMGILSCSSPKVCLLLEIDPGEFSCNFLCLVRTSCRPKDFEQSGHAKGLCFASDANEP